MNYKLLVIFCLGSCWSLFLPTLQATPSEAEQKFSNKVNLALRQVGHQLVLSQGDSTSTIPPVEIKSSEKWGDDFRLRLEQPINYDTLPDLLHRAFLSFGIQRKYQVMVEHCDDNILLLGYNQAAYIDGQIACGGRDRSSDCNIIVLAFEPAQSAFEQASSSLPFPLVFGVLGVFTFLFFRLKAQKTTDSSPASPTNTIALGSFSFDPQNQTLLQGEDQQSLTFRENKLLHFLAQHANQVVKRETLLAEVWEDEGVMVGRSLDVFISRLRKLLKADQKVAIKNIHGVGYRLEIAA